jgi:hypothetical protein
VDVVGHQLEGMDVYAVLCHAFLQAEQEERAIVVDDEDRGAVVASLDDVKRLVLEEEPR